MRHLFCSEFSAPLIWNSSTTRCHTLEASFHSIQQFTLVYHTRCDTLHYLTKLFILLDFHFWCITFAVMRHSTLPRRPTRVYSTSWDFPVRGPALIITFWFNQLRGVLYTRALTSSNSPEFLGDMHARLRRLPPLHFQENLR